MIYVVVVLAILFAAHSIWQGYRWSKLDHNPWKTMPLGGVLTDSPSNFPAYESVEDIRHLARMRMIANPLVALIVVLFALCADGRIHL